MDKNINYEDHAYNDLERTRINNVGTDSVGYNDLDKLANASGGVGYNSIEQLANGSVGGERCMGSITPVTRTTTLTIDTGLETINGFCIYPASESPLKSRGKTRISDFITPDGYYKRCTNISNTSGNGVAGDLLVRDVGFTLSGTEITIGAYDDYAYETIEYIWEAW